MRIAFLGAGLMGSAFVRRLLANGNEVNVWNRTPGRARALEAYGARAFADAAEAVRDVDRVHLSLADDASIDAVLEPLAAAIGVHAPIVDHTTTAPTPTLARVRRWDARGRTYVHAPVFMAPANALEGAGVVMVSGARDRFDALAPALQTMAGKVLYLGPAPERAAAFKLFGNLVLIGIAGVLGDVVRLAQACGVDPAEAMGLFAEFNPGLGLPARATRIASGPYEPPSFEIAMARKDVRLMIEEAQRNGFALGVMPAVAAIYDAAIARGEGHLDSTAAMRARPSQ